jgi:xylulokinase
MTGDERSGQHVLAIDLGSGGPKVGIVDADGRIVASAAEKTTTRFFPNGGAEQDPHEWWQAISLAARRVIREARLAPEAIFAVSCTCLWAVTVAVDENGEPLMNAVHWMDTRGAPYSQAATRGFPSVQGYGLGKLLKWLRINGLVPTQTGCDALAHMLFIKNERPDIYRRTWKLLEPVDYLHLKLSGRCVASQATVIPMMLADNRKQNPRDYHPWLVKASGIDKAKLPELLPNGQVIGKITPSVAAEWGLSPATEVVLGTTDNQSAAFGSGAVRDFDLTAVLGSSGFLAGHLPFRRTDISNMLTTIPSMVPDRWLILGELGNSGKVLDSYLNNLAFCRDELLGQPTPADVYARADAIAESIPPGSEGVLFLPWFGPPLAPKEDQAMRGGFLNLTHKTTRAHLTRAVLEGIAFNWKWIISAAQGFAGRKLDGFRLAGGGAKSPALAQIMADVVGLPMRCLADPQNANVLGAALLAFYHTGLLPLEEIPARVKIARVYEPRPEYRRLYDRLFRQFLSGFKALKPIYHALNGSH